MLSSIPSDPLLRAAFWAGALSLCLAVSVGLVIAALRWRLARRERAWAGFVASWRPALLAATLSDAPDPGAAPLPALRPADRLRLLRLWMYLHESVRGEAHGRLRALAQACGLPQVVRRRLGARSRAARLQAVLAAGLLEDAGAWDRLVRLAGTRDALLSVSAARSLARIDRARAAPLLLPLALARDDWEPGQLCAVLAAGGPAWHPALAAALGAVAPARLPRLLAALAPLGLPLDDGQLREWLSPGLPPAVLLAALPLARHVTLAAAVRPLLAHAEPDVRAAAAARMADLAGPGDVAVLARALADGQVPVRLAAARALAALPFIDRASLERMAPPGTPAARALRMVLAEAALAQGAVA